MGRPLKKLKLTPDQIEYLASIGCTDTEISALAGFKDPSGIAKRFSKILEKGREEGKTRLRKLQWASAQKGNVVMLIWLGKQILGQSEKVSMKSSNSSSLQIVVSSQEDADDFSKAIEAATKMSNTDNETLPVI
jgi:hypothetical protein